MCVCACVNKKDANVQSSIFSQCCHKRLWYKVTLYIDEDVDTSWERLNLTEMVTAARNVTIRAIKQESVMSLSEFFYFLS